MGNAFAQLVIFAALAGAAVPSVLLAQSAQGSAADAGSAEAGSEAQQGEQKLYRPKGHQRGSRERLVKISPYIEAEQLLQDNLRPVHDVLTYTRASAGVDANIEGRNTSISASIRYEHRFGYGGNIGSADSISGLLRGSTALTDGIKLEAGGLVTDSRVENTGAAVIGSLDTGSSRSRIYSAYVGPTVAKQLGDVAVEGSYRIGYTKIDQSSGFVTAGGIANGDVFDKSLVHDAKLRLTTRPGEPLPVGLGLGASYMQEDISNLDQRVKDMNVRGDITVPVTDSLALVGGVGYENVRVSSRDAVRDALGNPLVGPDGHYLTDKSIPRTLAYDAEGIIWDAGVEWRPGHRTSLEAHVGHRYGGLSYYGSFGYQPSDRSALNVSVYDSISGFGGKLNGALALLPSSFQSVRNPLTGDVGGCVASLEQGSCLNSALGSVRSATFRSRGISGSYSYKHGRYNYGFGGGYDRRRLIAAPGTVLASANGQIEQNYWATAFFNGTIDQHSAFSTNIYGNWLQSGSALGGDTTSYGATAMYSRQITSHLTGRIASGIDGTARESAPDSLTVSALVGVRYTF